MNKNELTKIINKRIKEYKKTVKNSKYEDDKRLYQGKINELNFMKTLIKNKNKISSNDYCGNCGLPDSLCICEELSKVKINRVKSCPKCKSVMIGINDKERFCWDCHHYWKEDEVII